MTEIGRLLLCRSSPSLRTKWNVQKFAGCANKILQVCLSPDLSMASTNAVDKRIFVLV